MKLPIATVPRLWPDSTVVCLGCGPSLTAADVDLCRRARDVRVIAVNDSYKLAPWADVLYAADANWWRKEKGALGFQGRKYTIETQTDAWPGLEVLRNTGKDGLELRPNGLRTGLNSGYQAINIAVHLGAARIVLLGYDMGHIAGQASHFYGEPRNPVTNHLRYGPWLKQFPTLVEPLRARGIEIVNCSRRTAITCFHWAALETVFHVPQLEATA